MFGNNLKRRLVPPPTVLYSTLKPVSQPETAVRLKRASATCIFCMLHFYLSSSRHKDTERLASVCLLLAATAGGCAAGGRESRLQNSCLARLPYLATVNLVNFRRRTSKTPPQNGVVSSRPWLPNVHLHVAVFERFPLSFRRKVHSLRNKSAGFSSPSADPRPELSDSLCLKM